MTTAKSSPTPKSTAKQPAAAAPKNPVAEEFGADAIVFKNVSNSGRHLEMLGRDLEVGDLFEVTVAQGVQLREQPDVWECVLGADKLPAPEPDPEPESQDAAAADEQLADDTQEEDQ